MSQVLSPMGHDTGPSDRLGYSVLTCLDGLGPPKVQKCEINHSSWAFWTGPGQASGHTYPGQDCPSAHAPSNKFPQDRGGPRSLALPLHAAGLYLLSKGHATLV